MSENEENRFSLFGTDLQKIPCFKQSFTYGICGGLAVGMGTFLATSRVKRSADLAVITFTLGTLGTWTYCRYKWSQSQQEARRLKQAVRKALLSGELPPEADEA